ncbi:MAG: hypothetical protein AB1796_05135 [Bacillota bacterium]
MTKFPENINTMFSKNPATGETLELLDVNDEFDKQAFSTSNVHLPEWVREKKVKLGFNPYINTINLHGWSVSFEATKNRGLVIFDVIYQKVYFIFSLLVPWVAQGDPCDLNQYFLQKKIAGPFVLKFTNGFLIWAKYKFGRFSALEQVYFFFDDGSFFPLILYTGPSILDFIPIYIDFDVIDPRNIVFNFYPPGVVETSWNLAVTEFSRLGAGATPEGESYNILIANSILGLEASAIVDFKKRDRANQYVARWLGYNLDEHPLLNLRGLEIVNEDIVYVYVIRKAPTGLFGPRVRLQKSIITDSKTWETIEEKMSRT